MKKLTHVQIVSMKELAQQGYGFDFPCSMRSGTVADAVKAAKWVLKVAR